MWDDFDGASSSQQAAQLVVLQADVHCEDLDGPVAVCLCVVPRNYGHEVVFVDVFILQLLRLFALDDQLKRQLFRAL